VHVRQLRVGRGAALSALPGSCTSPRLSPAIACKLARQSATSHAAQLPPRGTRRERQRTYGYEALVVTSVQRAPDEVTAPQVVLAGSALVVDVAIAVVLAVVLWPVGAAIAIFPLSVAGAFVARRRARFRALAALVAGVHVVIGAALF
jgi:hypothetical protein